MDTASGVCLHGQESISYLGMLLRGVNRVAVKQLDLDSGLKLKGTYNRKLHPLVLLKQN